MSLDFIFLLIYIILAILLELILNFKLKYYQQDKGKFIHFIFLILFGVIYEIYK